MFIIKSQLNSYIFNHVTGVHAAGGGNISSKLSEHDLSLSRCSTLTTHFDGKDETVVVVKATPNRRSLPPDAVANHHAKPDQTTNHNSVSRKILHNNVDNKRDDERRLSGSSYSSIADSEYDKRSSGRSNKGYQPESEDEHPTPLPRPQLSQNVDDKHG